MHISNQSVMIFGGNSSTTFSHLNSDKNDGFMYSTDSSMIIFEGNSIMLTLRWWWGDEH